MSTSQPGFGIEVRHDDQLVTVAVRGGVDAHTAEELSATLHTLSEERDVFVVDIQSVDTIDAAGLTALAATVATLTGAGATMTVRVTAPGARRIVGPNRSTPAVVGSLPSAEVIDAALRLVATLTSETLTNAAGVSVTLERHGRPVTVAASNDLVLRLDSHQYETGEGPCLSAKADGRRYYIDSLDDEQRWPAFVPLALEHGVHSILSSPLFTADRPLGSLNIYSTTKHAFNGRDQTLADLFSTQSSNVLTTAHAGDDDDKRRWVAGLRDRHTIAVAQGLLMRDHDLTPEQADEMLRHTARTEQLTVVQYATRMLSPHRGDDPGRAGP